MRDYCLCKNMGWSTYLTDLLKLLWKGQITKDEVLSYVTQECSRLLWASSHSHSTHTQTTPHLQPVSHKNVLMNSQFTPHANMHLQDGSKGLYIPAVCVCAYYLKTVWAQSLEHNWNVCFSPFCFSLSSKAISNQSESHDSYSLQPPTGQKRLEHLINKWGSEMRKQHLKCIRYGEATDVQISWTRWHFCAASVFT